VIDIIQHRSAAADRRARADTWASLATENRGYRALADRPRQRRSDEATSSPARVTVRAKNLELRESSDPGALEYEGWASVTDEPYEMWDMFGPYIEKVSPGAFSKTLAQVDLDVPLVLQHDALRRIARTTNGTLQLEEDEIGLHVLAPQLDPTDGDVAYIAPKLRSKMIDEMSFRFRITKGSWSSDWTEYHIDEVDIHRGDVAIVAYGANPATAGSGLRAEPGLVLSQLSDEQARAVLAELSQRFPESATVARGAQLISEEDIKQRVL
jgi:HK97 family phage prohead protease